MSAYRIRRRRLELGLTLRDVARLLETSVSDVSAMEREKRPATSPLLQLLGLAGGGGRRSPQLLNEPEDLRGLLARLPEGWLLHGIRADWTRRRFEVALSRGTSPTEPSYWAVGIGPTVKLALEHALAGVSVGRPW